MTYDEIKKAIQTQIPDPQLRDVCRKMLDERQHFGFDLAEAKGSARVFCPSASSRCSRTPSRSKRHVWTLALIEDNI